MDSYEPLLGEVLHSDSKSEKGEKTKKKYNTKFSFNEDKLYLGREYNIFFFLLLKRQKSHILVSKTKSTEIPNSSIFQILILTDRRTYKLTLNTQFLFSHRQR